MAWSGDYYAHHDDWESRDYGTSDIDYSTTTPYYKYEFKNEQDLITSAIFQKCLGQALAHKDKVIRELQQEILDICE